MLKHLWDKSAQKGLIQTPLYFEMKDKVQALCLDTEMDGKGYPALMLSAEEIGQRLQKGNYVEQAKLLMQQISSDEYTQFLSKYYDEGLQRFGQDWIYHDIVTVLLGLTDFIQPTQYLEIGVRRGRSVCGVALKAPQCSFSLFDLWKQNYAGMENPGPEFVEKEIKKVGHQGAIDFYNGNSHETLKNFFQKNPQASFDLITVDGDHSEKGAREDLCDVLPHLKIGGAVVMDDIAHPKHPYLKDVWQDLVDDDARFSSWSYDGTGFGVAFALRKW